MEHKVTEPVLKYIETGLPVSKQIEVLNRMRLEWEEAKFIASVNISTAGASGNVQALAMGEKALSEAISALDHITTLIDLHKK